MQNKIIFSLHLFADRQMCKNWNKKIWKMNLVIRRFQIMINIYLDLFSVVSKREKEVRVHIGASIRLARGQTDLPN